MATQTQATGEHIAGREPQTAELLDVRAVSELLGGCSVRHCYRLADTGRMPRPIKLGALIRWRRAEVLDWINAGCPPVRTVKAATR